MLKTGIDLVHVAQIKKMVGNEAALKRLLHRTELHNPGTNRVEHIAGIVAAKEAFFKALGSVPRWLDVEIVYEKNGKPRLKYSGILKQKIKEADVSISHDKDYAVASVVLILNK